ncbi:MAG: 3-dehydroquinate synthase [Candidatus Paceibacterota bacterium]|jgi:3-dehydroquinate synthase
MIFKINKNKCLIKIGERVLENFNFSNLKASSFVVICDKNSNKLFNDYIASALEKTKTPFFFIELVEGEDNKNIESIISAAREMVRKGVDRKAVIMSLGGGVVGDRAGFLASIYMRGIRYIQVPTTLLAQVDSGLGGKTGINIPEGKNLIGTIYQPEAIIIDAFFLKTLSDKEWLNGMAEIIKYAVIGDQNLFDLLEKNINNRSKDFILAVIKKCIKIKLDIVAIDEKENGPRKILNYGHTIGHALETVSEHKIKHGEAVASGMVYEAMISNMLGILSSKDMERQNKLIKSFGFNTAINLNLEEIVKVIKNDKKVEDKMVCFVLPNKIGSVKKIGNRVVIPVEIEVIRKVLKSMI